MNTIKTAYRINAAIKNIEKFNPLGVNVNAYRDFYESREYEYHPVNFDSLFENCDSKSKSDSEEDKKHLNSDENK